MKIIRDPLVHFLLIGALIFGVYSRLSKSSGDKPGEIVVTRSTIESLVTAYAKTWQRSPTEEEVTSLVREYIREEAAYRQAVAMGLDRDDTIVRRRLRQKLEFISDDLSIRVEPTDEELQAFLQSHASSFQTETTFTFHHVYLDPQKHGSDLHRETERLLRQLQASGEKANSDSLGDPFLLQRSFERVSAAEVRQVLGDKFASELATLKPGHWGGPIQSGYGTHLVFVAQREDGRLPSLAEVRNDVRREWLNVKRVEATEKFYQGLLQRYKVRVEPLDEPRTAQVR